MRLADHDELHSIISAPQDDDDICYQVIDAEIAVMRSTENQSFLFNLVNCQRLPQEGMEEQICSFGELVWKP